MWRRSRLRFGRRKLSVRGGDISDSIVKQREGMGPHSRGMRCPSLAPRFALFKSEGAGNAGCALHPRSRTQNCRKLRVRAYRAAEAIRHSLRNGFTAYNALSPVSRSSLATVAPGKLVSPELDASFRASGPH